MISMLKGVFQLLCYVFVVAAVLMCLTYWAMHKAFLEKKFSVLKMMAGTLCFL